MPLKKEAKAAKVKAVVSKKPLKPLKTKGPSLLIVESPAKERTISRLLK